MHLRVQGGMFFCGFFTDLKKLTLIIALKARSDLRSIQMTNYFCTQNTYAIVGFSIWIL